MVIVPSRREWVEKFWIKYRLRCWWIATKHFDLSSSLTASCVARFMICWVCRLYFSGLVCSVLSLDECLIKINYGRFCVCFRCLEKVILWSRLCLAKDEFRYHRSRGYLILLSGMNDLRRLVNMMWSTNVENIPSRRSSFSLGPHFCPQIKHTPLKKMIIRTMYKAVDCFSNVARVKYSVVTSRLHLLLLRW